VYAATRTFQSRQVSAAVAHSADLRHVRAADQSRAGTPTEECSLVALCALRVGTTWRDQRRRRSAFRQIRCTSNKPGRSLLCSSRAAGRARRSMHAVLRAGVERTSNIAEPATVTPEWRPKFSGKLRNFKARPLAGGCLSGLHTTGVVGLVAPVSGARAPLAIRSKIGHVLRRSLGGQTGMSNRHT
jgi:hypothetical protein